MSNNLNNIDNLFKEGLGSYTEVPPPDVWDALESRLDNDRKKRPLFAWRWFFVMLCCAGLFGSLYAWKMKSAPETSTGTRDIAAATTPQPAGNKSPQATSHSNTSAGSNATKTTTSHKKHTASANDVTNTYADNNTVNNTQTPTNNNTANSNNNILDNTAVAMANDGGDKAASKNAAIRNIVDNKNRNSAEPDNYNNSGYAYVQPVDEDDMTFGKKAGNDNTDLAAHKHTATNDDDFDLPVTALKHTAPKHTTTTAIARHTTTAHNTYSGALVVSRNTRHTATSRSNHSTGSATNTVAAPVAHKAGNRHKTNNDYSIGNGIATSTASNTTNTNAATTTNTSSKSKPLATTAGAAPVATNTQAKTSSNTAATTPAKNTANASADAPTTVATTTTTTVATVVTATKTAATTPVKRVKKHRTTTGAPATTADAVAQVKTTSTATHILSAGKPVATPHVKHSITTTTKHTDAPAVTSTTATATNTPVKHKTASAVTSTASATKTNKHHHTATAAVDNTNALADNNTTAPAKKTKHNNAAATPSADDDATANTGTAAKHGGKKTHSANTTAVSVVTKKPIVRHKKNKTATPSVAAKTNKHNNRNTNKTTPPPANVLSSATTSVTPPATIAEATPPATTTAAPDKVMGTFKNEAPETIKPAVHDTMPAVVAAAAATDSGKKKFKFGGLVYGVKAGYEGGFTQDASNKLVISPYIERQISNKFSVMLQPAIKSSRARSNGLSGTQTFYKTDPNGTITNVDTFLIPVIQNNQTNGYLVRINLAYSEKHDSIVKSYATGGSYMEFELPIMMKYAITPKLSVYGGVSLNYSKYIQVKENTFTSRPIMVNDTTFTIYPTAPAPISSVLTYAGKNISTYSGPMYPTQSGGLFRLGYMLGFSYEIQKRWMVDVLLQKASAKTNMQGGYDVNKGLSTTYFRFTLGYRLSK